MRRLSTEIWDDGIKSWTSKAPTCPELPKPWRPEPWRPEPGRPEPWRS